MTFKTFVPKSIAAVIERRCHGARSRGRSCHTGDREHKNKKARITRVPRLRHMYRACTTPDTGGGGPASGCACERIFLIGRPRISRAGCSRPGSPNCSASNSSSTTLESSSNRSDWITNRFSALAILVPLVRRG